MQMSDEPYPLIVGTFNAIDKAEEYLLQASLAV